MEKNAIVAIALSVLILIVWQQVFIAPKLEEERAQQEELVRQEEQGEVDSSQAPVQQVQEIPVPVEGTLPSKEAFERQVNANAQKIHVKTPLLEVTLTTQGSRIIAWKILKHTYMSGEAVELVSDDALQNGQYPLEVYTSDAALDEELNMELYQSSTQSVELKEGDDPETLSLWYETRSGITFTKELTFYPDSYKVDLVFKFSDPSQVGNAISVIWGPGLGKDLGNTMRFEPGAVSKTGGDDDPIRDAAKKIDGLITHRNVLWAAMNQKYFTAAFFAGNTTNTLSLSKIPLPLQEEEEKIEPMRQLLIGLSQPLSSGESQLSLYAGPKERAELAKAYGGFERLIDYGFFSFIAEPLARFMTFLYTYVKNYGVVIICLTILIKLVFYPLTRKSFQSMKRMQELQPKMNAIKEKHKKEQQKQQQEMMKLYKQEGVNPMGGCLPMVLQIPVFFALYQTLSQSIELRGASFLWIPDLSAHEVVSFLQGTFLGPYSRPLVLMMGASMFLQQSMTPTAADNKQAQLFKFMPILFTAMFWSFPAGLVLYWFMNNILTIGQQYLINKSHGKPSKKSATNNEETTSASTSSRRRKKGK